MASARSGIVQSGYARDELVVDLATTGYDGSLDGASVIEATKPGVVHSLPA